MSNPFLDAYSVDIGGGGFAPLDALTPSSDPFGDNAQYLPNSNSNISEKELRLKLRAQEKQAKLRKDDVNYGHDNALTRGVKGLFNSIVDHDNQVAVNYEGKRYNTQNKNFNDSNSLTGLWDEYTDDPNGHKSLYYLRKSDGVNEDGSTKYIYKAGIAQTSAADRYRGQLAESGWDLIGEKRFDEATDVEKYIHGSKAARDARSFDYGTYNRDYELFDPNKADNIFGAGISETYDKDILGLDTGTQEEYDLKKQASIEAMRAADMAPYNYNDTFESLDALGAATQSLVGRGIKAAGQWQQNLFDPDADGDGAIEAYGKSLEKTANDDWDYNPKALKDGEVLIKRGAKAMATGGVLDKIGGAFDFIHGTLKAAPQAVAGSAPEMALYLGGGLRLGAQVVGLALVNTNDALDAREQANDGKKATAEETAAALAGQLFASAIDAGSFRFVSKLGEPLMIARKGAPKASFADEIAKLNNNTKWEMAKALIAKPAGRAGVAMGTEAIQETTTEAIRMLTESLGTDKYGNSAWDILTSAQGQNRLSSAAALGSAGGFGFNAPSSAISTVKDVNKVRNRAATAKNSKIAGENVESMEDAIIGKEVADMDYELAENEYNELNKAYTAVDNAETISDIGAAVEASVLDTDAVAAIETYIKENPDVSTTKLRQVTRDVISNRMEGIVELGKKKQDVSSSLAHALTDPILQKREPDEVSVAKENMTPEEQAIVEEGPVIPEEPTTQFEREMPKTWKVKEVMGAVGTLIKEAPEGDAVEYLNSLDKAKEQVLKVGKNSKAAKKIADVIDTRISEVNNPDKPTTSTDFKDEYVEGKPEEFADNVTKYDSLKYDLSLDELTLQEDRLNAALETVEKKEAESYVNSTTVETRKATPKEMSEGTKKLNNDTEVKASNTELNSLQTSIDKATTPQETEVATKKYTEYLDNVHTPLVNQVRGYDGDGNIISPTNESTSQSYNTAKAKINEALADIAEEIEVEKETEKAATYAFNKQEAKKQGKQYQEAKSEANIIRSKMEEAKKAHDAKTPKLSANQSKAQKEVNALEKKKENASPAEVLILDKKITAAKKVLHKAEKELKAHNRKVPEVKSKEKIRQEIHDRNVKKRIKQRKEIKKTVREVRREAKNKETEQRLRKQYSDEKHSNELTKEVETLNTSIEELTTKFAKMETVPESEMDKLNTKLAAKERKQAQIEAFNETEFNTAIKMFKDDRKVDADRKAAKEKDTATKEENLHKARQEEVTKRTKIFMGTINNAIEHYGLSKVTEGTDRATKKTAKVNKKKNIKALEEILSRTGSETYKLLRSPEAQQAITNLLGLDSDTITKELNKAVEKRGISKEAIGINQGTVKGYDSQQEFVRVMTPVQDAVRRLKDDKGLETPRSTQEVKNDVAAVNNLQKSLNMFVAGMSRAQFKRFTATKEFNGLADQTGIPMDIKDVAELIGKKPEDIMKVVEKTVKMRAAKEGSNLETKRFVSRMSKANIAEFQEDIDLAKHDNDYLLKNKLITEKQHKIQKDLLNDLQIRSKKEQDKVAEEIAKKQETAFEKATSTMEPEVKEAYTKYPPYIALQLLTQFGITGDLMDSVKVKDIKIGKDTVTVSAEC